VEKQSGLAVYLDEIGHRRFTELSRARLSGTHAWAMCASGRGVRSGEPCWPDSEGADLFRDASVRLDEHMENERLLLFYLSYPWICRCVFNGWDSL